MANQTTSKMPGPGFLRSLRYSFEFKRDYLKPMEGLHAKYGDYVHFTGGVPVCLVTHPDAVEYVLKTNAKNYTKAADLAELRPMLGEGLLTSDGDHWRQHRRVIAPEFQQKKVDLLYPVIRRHFDEFASGWRKSTVGTTIDVAPAMSKLTYGIAGECFFGANLEDSADTVYRTIDIASAVTVRRMASPFKLPMFVPVPDHLRVKKAIREMNEIVYRIIDDRIARPSESHDVLSRLTRASSDPSVKALSRQEIRDEVMTLLLAGHETTANALSWTLYLLGLHPGIQAKLREEVRSVVAGETPDLVEIRKLSYTKAVLEEGMRLYPPAATIGRQSIEADTICGFEIAPRTIVNLAQWITHRLPEFWTRPNEFVPERFLQGEPKHPFAYYPFAAGLRECVGKNMAMIEGIAILAGLIKNFDFELVNRDVRVRPLITIRPDPGVFMKVSAIN